MLLQTTGKIAPRQQNRGMRHRIDDEQKHTQCYTFD